MFLNFFTRKTNTNTWFVFLLYIAFGFGKLPASAGANTNSSSNNPFASGSFSSCATPFAASTGATMFSGNSTTGPTAFGQLASSSSTFGVGQTNNSSNPGSFGTVANPFAASTGATMFPGNSTTGPTAFGQLVSSSPFGIGIQSTFGQTNNSSNPGSFANAFASGNPTTGLTAFSQLSSSSPFGTQSIFGQTNNSNNPGSFGTAVTPFSASTGAAMFPGNSTTGTNAFGQLSNSSPFGTRSTFGQTNNSSNPNPFASTSANLFGTTTGTDMFSGNSSGRFGGTSSSFAFGTSASSTAAPFSTFGTPSLSSTGASIFNNNAGSLFQPSQSTSANNGFNPSSQSGFASSSALPSSTSTNVFSSFQAGGISGSSVGSPFGFSGAAFSCGANGVSNTSIFGPPSNFNSAASKTNYVPLKSIFGQPSSQFGFNKGPTAWETKSFPTSSHPPVTSLKFEQLAIDGQRRGSRIESYVATKEVVGTGSTGFPGNLVSISAMPAYKDKSHEELRFEDSQFSGNKDWNGFSTSATTTVASFSPTFNSVASSETASGFISGLTGNRTLSLPYQTSEPSAGRTNAFIGPNVVTFQSQPQTSNAISTGTTQWGNLFSTTPSLVSTSNSAGITWTKPELTTTPQITQTPPETPATSAWISQPSIAAVYTGTSCQSTEMLQPKSQSNSTPDPEPSIIASPFGMESRFQMSSVGCPTSGTTVQFGISCIPVSDKPAPVKRSSLLTARHLSVGRYRLSGEKLQPKSDSQKVPFYEELPKIYKLGASFIPRVNPRSWVMNPMVEGHRKTNSSNFSSLEEDWIHLSVTENSDERRKNEVVSSSAAVWNINLNDTFDATSAQVDEIPDQHESYSDLEAILPKLKCPDYYTKPPIQELAAKERAEPGFCSHVQDFVVGREGYGSIRFFGETDLRNLDLESIVQFKYREVSVYMDTGMKPEVGKGLNKAAEVTLLNVKCICKNTGKQYVDGSKIDKWRNLLIKKAEEQDADFVSYDPVIGEWKFRVKHF